MPDGSATTTSQPKRRGIVSGGTGCAHDDARCVGGEMRLTAKDLSEEEQGGSLVEGGGALGVIDEGLLCLRDDGRGRSGSGRGGRVAGDGRPSLSRLRRQAEDGRGGERAGASGCCCC